MNIAAKKNDAELLRMICEKGVPASIRKRDSHSLTPFMIAAKHGCKDSLEYLHKEAKVDIYTKDSEGQNAVHYAALGGDIDCFVYLVKVAKLDYKQCNNVNGNTVLHTAAKHGNLFTKPAEETRFLAICTMSSVICILVISQNLLDFQHSENPSARSAVKNSSLLNTLKTMFPCFTH